MSKLKTAVIMAGGKGTRLSSITGVLPKPMVNIRGTQDAHFGEAKDTILEHQIDLLSENGVTDFILVVGHKRSFIQKAFTNEIINRNIPGRNISIRYFEEQEQAPLGTGGSFCSKDLQAMIGQDDFILTYADVLFDVNIQDMFRFHQEQGADATMLVGSCSQPDDRVLCHLGKDGSEITKLIQKQGKDEGPRGSYFPNVARNGITIFNTRLFETLPSECTYMDMESDILDPMVYNPNYKVCAWRTPCYVKDIGTIDRFEEGVKELEAGIPEAKNPAKQKQSCVVVREQDIYGEDGRIDRDMATAIGELNDKGVIVGLQKDVPEIDNTRLGEMRVDTDLIRQGDGAFVNFRFDEEDIKPLLTVMGEWNIAEELTYGMEKSVTGVGYLIYNFAEGERDFKLSATASAYHILSEIESQRTYENIEQQTSTDEQTLGAEEEDASIGEGLGEQLDNFGGVNDIKQNIFPQAVLPEDMGQ